MAAGQGDLSKVKKLVDKGADINIKDSSSGVSIVTVVVALLICV